MNSSRSSLKSYSQFFGLKFLGILSIGVSCLAAEASFASNWPTSVDGKIPVTTDIQADRGVLKIASNKNNDFFISWFDQANGNYNMKMQRLDSSGAPQWSKQGKVISNHPQRTWVTSYDLITSPSNDAYLFFTDIRRSRDHTDLQAYRISKDGEALWGEAGKALSNNTKGDSYLPQSLATNDGNVLITWIDSGENERGSIYIRKLTPAGQDVWPKTLTIKSDKFDLQFPRIIEGADGSILIQYIANVRFSGGMNEGHIVAQKIDADGQFIWPKDGVVIAESIYWHPGRLPEFISDGQDGAYFLWSGSPQDPSANPLDSRVFAQHVDMDGNPFWSTALEISATPGSHSDYRALLLPDSDDLLVFFATEIDQSPKPSIRKIYGQRVHFDEGKLLWGDQGKMLTPETNKSISHLQVHAQKHHALLAYISDNTIQALQVDDKGGHLWKPATREVAKGASISDLVSSIGINGEAVFAWKETSATKSVQIFAKMLGAKGALGK